MKKLICKGVGIVLLIVLIVFLMIYYYILKVENIYGYKNWKDEKRVRFVNWQS
jgi:hypothetical protein